MKFQHKRSVVSRLLAACFLLLVGTLAVQAQFARLGKDVRYGLELNGTVAKGDYAPFYLTANRYGLSSLNESSGYVRAGIMRGVEADSARRWRIGYGADVAVAAGFTSTFVVQQLYADMQYKDLRLSVGAKERASELKNEALSSGGMTSSANARPVPQVRIELPDFWKIPGTRDWLAIKGHLAYGRFTDDNWQEGFHKDGTLYSANVLYHSKAGFLRVGNKQKFPLTFTGGLEMYTQFGGEAWNVIPRHDDPNFDNTHVQAGNGLESFWNVLVPGGRDASDGDYANSEGNKLGSWHFQLEWHGKGWGIKAYAEHYFEDHSQLFLEYGWKDMLYGVELSLPENPVAHSFLYEYLRTTDQTGGVYHDKTDKLPVQISGIDNYYNHNFYGGWQHWGQAMGNPLMLSPIYNKDGTIMFKHNRIRAHHFGIAGQPLPELGYRALFSHVKSLGTYAAPLTNPAYGNCFMLELDYAPRHFHGLSFTGTFATNGGSLTGNSKGGMLTIRKSGIFGR